MCNNYSACFENGMLAAYAENSTVPLFLIMLGPSSRIIIQGNVLMHESKTQTPQEIYRASTPVDAVTLLLAIDKELQHRMGNIPITITLLRFLVVALVLIGLAYIISSIIVYQYQYQYQKTHTPPPAEISRNMTIPVTPQVMPPVAVAPPATTPLALASFMNAPIQGVNDASR
ncbi:hypothetical protein CKP64_15625 [Salmonella enterica]|nr:hypothetical protein [Salmonella enterica]